MISQLRLFAFCLLCLLPAMARGQGVQLKISGEVILGPAAGEDNAAWGRAMHEWRQKRRAETHYDGSQYGRPELAWAQRSFIQPLVMVEERYLYDPVAGKYTVDRYLDDLETRYGGIDSVLIWPVYPNIGIDNRNQHDLLHDMPGGLPGLRQMVADFHRRGVRVLFPVMPWDVGTRPEGVPLWAAAARDMKAIGADGINGDTMGGIGREFRKASDDCGHPLVLEPENQLGDDGMIAWNNMSLGLLAVPACPGGEQVQMDRAAAHGQRLRALGTGPHRRPAVGLLQRRGLRELGKRVGHLEPAHAARRRGPAAYRHDRAGHGRIAGQPRLATALSHAPGRRRGLRQPFSRQGPDLVAAGQPQRQGRPWRATSRAGRSVDRVSRSLAWGQTQAGRREELGHAEFPHGETRLRRDPGHRQPADLAARENPLAGNGAERGPADARVHLAELSAQWKCLPQKIVDIPRTAPATATPEGMVLVRGGKYRFQVSGVEIEGGDGPGVDFQYPWEDLPRRQHDKEMDIQAFYIDKYPVTNAQFKRFLDASGYKPKDEHNFLKDWQGGTLSSGLGPQTGHLGLAGGRPGLRRLGRQAAAARMGMAVCGAGQRRPALSLGQQSGCRPGMPKPESGRELRPPTDVDAYPKGASPWGVMDLVGNVWQWTDEYVDEHTRAAVVRGGSYYRPSGSRWYFPQNTRLDQHGEVPAHRPVERSFADARLPLRRGCGGGIGKVGPGKTT